MKWLKRILTGLLVIVLVISLAMLISFRTARKSILENLPGVSQLAETSSGKIEYLIQGNSDKYIMLLHGSPGSYRTFNTQVLLDHGFSVISPSRPGYFRTPITTGETLEEEADALAALLDALKIDSVAMIGFSGSGPVAIEFALRHQHRITDLVIISGIMEKLPKVKPNMMLKFMSTDFGSWVMSNIMPGKFEDQLLKKESKTYLRETLIPRSSVESGHINDISHFTTLRDFPFEDNSMQYTDHSWD